MKRMWMLAVAALVAGGCGEDLDAGKGCPVLCPTQSLPVRDTVLNAIAFDTTLGTFPVRGTEAGLLLAERGDTLDVRAIVRFDSLPKTYTQDTTTHDIVAVDSARLFVRLDTGQVHFAGTITLEAYDVDTTAADTNTAALTALFRADRRIGSIAIDRATLFLDDTFNIPIPNSFLLAKIQGGQHVRVGFQIVGAGDIALQSVETGLPVALKYDPAPGNTAVASRGTGPISRTPTGDLIGANDLLDYSLVVKAPPLPSARIIAGGLPAYRSFLKFAIPSFFFDSVVVVRAQLSLVQRPLAGLADTAKATIYPVVVSSTGTVTDLLRAAQLTFAPATFGIAAIVQAPKDSGERRVDIVQLVRQWAAASHATNPIQTAIVLRGGNEGRAPGRLLFFGLDAPAGLRPKLILSYVARSRFGIP